VVLSCNLIVIVHFCFVLFLYLLLYKKKKKRKKKERNQINKGSQSKTKRKSIFYFFKRLLKICNISRDTNVLQNSSIHIIWRKLRITFISKIFLEQKKFFEQTFPFEQTPVSLWTSSRATLMGLFSRKSLAVLEIELLGWRTPNGWFRL